MPRISRSLDRRRPPLIAALRATLASLSPASHAAWLEGRQARGKDAAEHLLRVGVLTTVRERHALAEQLALQLRDIERKYDVTIDLLVRTRADLGTLPPPQQDAIRQAILLYGELPPPTPLASVLGDAGRPASTHADLDARSQARGAQLAQAIMQDPCLVEQAQRWVQERLLRASPSEARTLREWEHILTLPPHRIGAILRHSGEPVRSSLRQASDDRTPR